MARTRSVHFDDIRQGILAKAAVVFAQQGYERSSIADLIAACGLSRGALYHYFQSKEAILFDLLHTHVQGLLARIEAAFAEGGSPVEQLSRAIETIVEYNSNSVSEQIILLNDLASLGKTEQEQIVKLERRIVALVADALLRIDSAGKITPATKSVYAMMLFGILNFAHTWYNPSKGIKPKEMARMATDLFLNGFLSTGSQRSARTQSRSHLPAKLGLRVPAARR
jgi:AcrR family transcriptional regulator